MQKIEYRQGDVLTTDTTHIVHGCNSHGVMGSGVAKAIRDKYPAAYRDYNDVYNGRGLELGDLILSAQSDGKIIINAITQKDFGSGSRVYVSYWAIAETFRKIENLGIKEISLPKIGSGLAGGNWDTIEQIIENTLTRVKPIVYYID